MFVIEALLLGRAFFLSCNLIGIDYMTGVIHAHPNDKRKSAYFRSTRLDKLNIGGSLTGSHQRAQYDSSHADGSWEE